MTAKHSAINDEAWSLSLASKNKLSKRMMKGKPAELGHIEYHTLNIIDSSVKI